MDENVTRDARDEDQRPQGTEDLDQVVKQQHAAALSALAGGIAHRLNNVLSGVLGGAFMIRQKLPEGSDLEKSVSLIEKAGEEATALAEQLLAFARRDINERTPVDIRSLMHDCKFFLKHVINRRINIETDIDTRGAAVLANPSLLLQAITNVGVNGAEAIDGEGTLRIDVERVASGESNAAEEIVISISDTGTGIADDARGHLFEPHYTTRDRNTHAGLGLAAAQQIIHGIGGQISLRSTGPTGSCFELRLPTHRPPETAEETKGQQQASPKGSGCILVVDDEPSLVRLMTVYLKSLGYEVLSAGDGQEAVDIYSAHPDKIDLAIIDLSMPIMDGPECFKTLQTIRPDVKVIFTTGHDITTMLGEDELQHTVGNIKKPFKPAELGALVHKGLKG